MCATPQMKVNTMNKKAQTAKRPDLKNDLAELLESSSLTKHDKMLMEFHLGLKDGKPKTFEETGHKFGITRERTRQIVVKAFRKIRPQLELRFQLGFGSDYYRTLREVGKQFKIIGKRIRQIDAKAFRKNGVSDKQG